MNITIISGYDSLSGDSDTQSESTVKNTNLKSWKIVKSHKGVSYFANLLLMKKGMMKMNQ